MKKMTERGYMPITLNEVYDALPPAAKAPKQLFIERMADACKCSQQTIRMWLSGVQCPRNEIVIDTLLDAMVSYGYLKSREDIDVERFFPKQLA